MRKRWKLSLQLDWDFFSLPIPASNKEAMLHRSMKQTIQQEQTDLCRAKNLSKMLSHLEFKSDIWLYAQFFPTAGIIASKRKVKSCSISCLPSSLSPVNATVGGKARLSSPLLEMMQTHR